MLPIHIIHQIAQALAEKYPDSANDFFRMSEAISLVTAGADIIAAREEVPSDVAYEDAFDDWHDAVRYDETVWYEPIVQKQRLNSIYGLNATMRQPIIPGYFDTDSSYPEYLTEEGYVNEMTYWEKQQLRKAMEILVSLYYGNHETHPTHTTDPGDCDRTETKYPTGTTTCTG